MINDVGKTSAITQGKPFIIFIFLCKILDDFLHGPNILNKQYHLLRCRGLEVETSTKKKH